MTSRERIMMTVNHQEPDRVPLDLGAGKSCKFTKVFYEKLLDYFGFKEDIVLCHQWAQLVYPSERVLKELDTDVRSVLPAYLPQEGDRESMWEEDGVKYYRSPTDTLYKMPKGSIYYDMTQVPLENSEDEETDRQYVWAEPKKMDPRSIEAAEAFRAAGFPLVATEQYANGFLQTGPTLFGYENWLIMLATEPERVEYILEALLEKKKAYWDEHFKTYGATLDMISENDDFGTQSNLMVSPSTLRKLVFPYYHKLYDYVKSKADVKVVHHSCGAIFDIIPDIIKSGVDCLNPVQITSAGMDPAKLKQAYGKDITFWGGGVDTQQTLPNGTVQEVKDMVKRNLDIFAPGGGYVFSMVHNVQADVPVRNFMAMWEAYKDNCKY